MQWINRLEFKLGRLAVPNLMHYIAGLNVLTFLLYKTIDPHFFELLNLDPGLIMKGQLWRLFTYIFIPSLSFFPFSDYLSMLFYSMYLVFLGNGLEQAWGAFKLNLFYFIGMLGTTIAAFFFGAESSNFMLNSSLFFAFARFYPDMMIYLFYVLPVKIKWVAWVSAAWLLMQFLASSGNFRAALIASMANYFLFFGKEIYKDARMRKTVTERRSRFQRDQIPEAEPLHACAVCGKTDLSHVELEFRVGKDGQDYCIEHLPKA